ncbi:glucan biosynthesis protein [Mesorhizobium xinjiangense]|uniref:glucan biosynthesis protein n=1 Tax=Mesorhizobium xinjiangense TaxID=2678685 RepID=UPI001F426E21|nr:glucan biosynthesis protein G [Mesorhizobium xinjiangense]
MGAILAARGMQPAAAADGDGAASSRAGETPAPFSFDHLSRQMQQKAGEAFEDDKADLPAAIAELSYDEHRAIRYRPDHAVWKGQAPFELQAFHLGWLYTQPVSLFAVENGRVRPLSFSGADFEYRKPLDAAQFVDLEMPGVAGFRLHYPLNRPDIMDELAVFLGASYFRALGRGSVYGLSARGLAVNTATQAGEEFPRFDAFYIEKPKSGDTTVTLYATLDSLSVTGAYAFTITPGDNTVVDVTARLFLRRDIERLGVAPMTSMFLFAENNRHAFDDYRNQVHDSDGLKIVRRNGEEIWRSLNNPGRLANSYLVEENPRAFGLFQRDRNFASFQDAGASYERRPSLLIEPLNDWGKGTVALVEIPTDLEVNDNIVAFWTPDEETTAGKAFEFRYRMTWGMLENEGGGLARVQALRGGHGGTSGSENTAGLKKFVVDFAGGALENLTADDAVKAVIKLTNADMVHESLSRVKANGVWRLVIDVKPQSKAPVEFSAHLTHAERTISEIWLYQWRVDDERAS